MWGVVSDILVALLRSLWRKLGALYPELRTIMLTGVITTLLLFAGITGWNMIVDGGITRGWRDTTSLFTRNSDGRPSYVQEQQHMRQALQQEGNVQRIILALLGRGLTFAPGIARVRLMIIHDGADGLNPIAVLHFDIAAVMTAPGYAAGDAASNVSLLAASDFLDALLAQHCQFEHTADLSNAAFKTLMSGTDSVAFLACPILSPDRQVLGFTTKEWDRASDIPSPMQLPALMREALRLNDEIGVALAAARH